MKTRWMQSHTSQVARLRKSALVVLLLSGLLLGTTSRNQAARANTAEAGINAAAAPALLTSQLLPAEQGVTPPPPDQPPTGMAAVLSTQAESRPQPQSTLAVSIMEPLLGFCSTTVSEVRCAPPAPGSRAAGEVPPELIATLRGESSPLLAARGTTTIPPTTLTVATTNMTINGDITDIDTLLADPGPDGISFVEALTAVNNSGDGHTIKFASSLKGKTLVSGYSLYLNVSGTTIDGDTDNDGFPDLMLDGPDGYLSLDIRSNNNKISKLVLTGLGISGGNDNVVTDCYIGTDLNGKNTSNEETHGIQIGYSAHNNIIQSNVIAGNVMTDAGKNAVGVLITHNAHHNSIQDNWIGVGADGNAAPNEIGVGLHWGANQNTIGGDLRSSSACSSPCNIISGNTRNGVLILGSGTISNVVQGNFIGVGSDGTTLIPNFGNGVVIAGKASQNTIGGTRAGVPCTGPCNLISGNAYEGVWLADAGTQNNLVLGNYIGVDAGGTSARANAHSGIVISDGASQNTIGGDRPSADCTGPCNLISGNTYYGVWLTGAGTQNNQIKGNYIGTNSDGADAVSNGATGILIETQASQNTIGGRRPSKTTCSGPCNLISGNGLAGVAVVGAGNSLNVIQGNYIGTNKNGADWNMGNKTYGVGILDASGNQIGGGNSKDGNRIVDNLTGGIFLFRSSTTGDPTHQNLIRLNEIYGNAGPGIDMYPDTGGPNDDQKPPVLYPETYVDSSYYRLTGTTDAPNFSQVDVYDEAGHTYLGTAIAQGGSFSVNLDPNLSTLTPPVVATVTDPSGNTSEFSGYGALFLSAPNALPGDHIFAFGVLTQTWDLKTIKNAQKVKIKVGDKDYPLYDNGKGDDFFKNDAYHTGWITAPTKPGDYPVELMINGTPAAVVTLNITQKPQLVILTDLKALKDEFVQTSSINEAKKIYEALKRLSEYAKKYQGILIDLKQEVEHTNPGDNVPYKNYTYTTGFNHRRNMGRAIDNYIKSLATYRNTLKYIAIIGDDAVVPFFRLVDPADFEKNYPGEIGGDKKNATLTDSGLGYILTDIPYASFGNNNPEGVKKPTPDLSIGRIFFATPLGLKNAFDAYDTPIDVRAMNNAAAAIFLRNEPGTDGVCNDSKHDNEHVCWEFEIMKAIRPQMSGNSFLVNFPFSMPNQFLKKNFYEINGAGISWKRQDVLNIIQKTNPTLLYSHAMHLFNTTEGNAGGANGKQFTGTNLAGLPSLPGHLLINPGCHAGYAVSRAGSVDYYSGSLVTAALSRNLTYLAPTTYGLNLNTKVDYHNRLIKTFLWQALHGNAKTVGEAFRNAQRGYDVQVPDSMWNKYHTYTRYGTELYGLPTQCFAGRCPQTPALTREQPAQASTLSTPDATAQSQAAASLTTHTLDVVVDIPHFQVVTNSDGTVHFELPNTGGLGGSAHYPILPEVLHTYRLPAGATVSSITLITQTNHLYPSPVTLETVTPVNRTFGPQPGQEPLTSTYPAQIYWYGAAELDDSVLLYVGVNPMQYDPATQQVTLYDQVQLRVTYQSPDSSTTLTGITLNNGSPVSTGMSSLPLQFTINSTQAANLTLDYEVYDMAGTPLAQDTTSASLGSGSSTVNLTGDTLGWHPGPMLLTASLRDGDTVIDTLTVAFTAQGRSLEAYSNQPFYNTEITGTLYTRVYDQDGAGVTGLGTVFTATLDGAPLSLSFTENSPGNYQADFSLLGLSEGIHTLQVGLPGTGVVGGYFDMDHTPPTATLDTLPLNFPRLAVPVSWSGADEGSGIDYYELQYAIGTTATWTTWMTATAYLDYLPGESTAVFGPYSPVQTQYNEWYYFRVRAVDHAGNAGTFPAGQYIETYTYQNDPVELAEAIARVVELTNQVRASQNPPLPPLKLNLLLNASAQEHSNDTAYNGLSGHTGSDGSAPEDRIYRNGYDYQYAGENWAAGQQNPDDVVNAWVNSPTHFANLTHSLYREIGVGYTFNPLDTNNSFHYWVQNFGAREDVYPVVINGEAETTSSSTVSLYIYGQGWAQDMQISNDPLFPGANWQPYTSTITWTLQSGQGERAVYVKLRKSVTETQTVSDTILLGISAPRGVDLSVTKTDDPDPVKAGDLLTYTLVVANQGPSDATGVQLYDTLSATLDLQDMDASWGYCSEAAGSITCDLDTVAAGESVTITLVTIPDFSAIGVLANTAVITSYETDNNTANNSATSYTTVKGGGRADLVVTKTDAPDPAYLGTITYTIRLENQGPTNALTPVLTDTMPAGMSFNSVQATSGFSCAQNSGTVTCNQAVLNAGTAVTVTITALPGAAGTYTNSVTVSLDSSQIDPDTANNTATAVTTVAQAFVVNSTGDGGDSNTGDGACNDGSGNCTLRAAIQQANATPGLDIIAFNIPGGGVHTIQPVSALPVISDTVYLDASTQPGYAGTPLIEIDGSLAGSFVDGLSIYPGADGSTVRGLAINRFSSNGISVNGADGNTLSDNFIGTDPTGTLDRGNSERGIFLASSANTIENNLISGNGYDGMILSFANQNQIQGNKIGTDINGTVAISNTNGILISDGLTNTIRNNLISGNAWRGVYLSGPYLTTPSSVRNNLIAGNKIGTNISGTAALPNLFGVYLQDSYTTTVGGPNPEDGNLISGNNGCGVAVGDVTDYLNVIDSGHVIQGNKIGTDITGTAALPNYRGICMGVDNVVYFRYGGSNHQILDNLISGNTSDGIYMVGAFILVQGNKIGSDITGSAYLGNGADGIYVGPTYFTNTIKANLISGNATNGIEIAGGYWDSPAVIQGNTIGADATGTTTLANGVYGIEVDAMFNLIGGPNPGDGNVISRNGTGIKLYRGYNTIQGNIIGLTASGDAPLGNLGPGIDSTFEDYQTIKDNLIGANQTGIRLGGSSTVENNIIGTDVTGALDLGNVRFGVDTAYSSNNTIRNNVIAFNDYSGILNDSGIQNEISANSIYSNTQLGIDLDNDLVTPNDAGDADSGGNNRQNFPVLTSATAGASNTIVQGSLNSVANTIYRLEFFASPQCDSSGYGEGRDYLGYFYITTDGGGNAAFNETLSAGSTVGYAVTATATDPNGNSSEFSQCVTIGVSANLGVSKSVTPNPVNSGSPVTYTVTIANAGPSNASGIVLTDTLPAGVTFGSAAASQGSCGYAGSVVTCTLGTLNEGDSANVTLAVTPTVSGNLINTAQVAAAEADPDLGDNTASVDLAVDPADLILSKTAAPEPAFVGSFLTYTLTVTNSGPLTATNVTLTDTLPGGVSFLSASAGCAHNSGVVACSLGSLSSGNSLSATIVVSPTAPGVITNTAAVRAGQGDPNLTDNTDTAVATVSPADLAVTKTDLSDPATANRPLTYQVVLANNGPANALQVVLTDNLPAGADFISASSGTPSVPCGQTGGVVTCAANSIAAGARVTITIAVTPTVTGLITNTVNVTELNPDPDASNNAASESTTIVGGVDLSIDQTAQPNPAIYLQPLTYTLVVSNAGALPATGVVITDQLSSQVSFISATSTQGSCLHIPASGGDQVTCSPGALSPGAYLTITIVVSPTSWGTWLDPMLSNSATVSSAEADANPADNSTTLTQPLRETGDARWDTRFTLPGTDGSVTAMTIGGNGDLYIGGNFTAIGDVIAYDLARWDGAQWESVSGGLDTSASALAEHNGNLYAGGNNIQFYNTNRTQAFTGNIAFWDGAAWNNMSGGVNSTVQAIAVGKNGEIYVGGDFTSAGGVSVNGLAVWNGSSWADVGGGVTTSGSVGTVQAIGVDPATGDVYVAGGFDAAGGVSVSNIARWDGAQWHTLGSGAEGTFANLLVQGGEVYIVGGFWTVGGSGSANAAVWDGSAWTTLLSQVSSYGGSLSGDVRDAAFFGGDLYVIGWFDSLTDAQNNTVTAHNIARWDGSSWSEVGDGVGYNNGTGSLYPPEVIAGGGGKVFVGGQFINAGDTAASHVAQWDGSSWSPLVEPTGGQGSSGPVRVAVTAANGDIYAGGDFATAGRRVVNYIARWDGAQWHPLGNGLTRGSGYMYAAALALAPNGDLYAGGAFTKIGAITTTNIAKWDGASWSALGSGMDDIVQALAVDPSSGDLYAGGRFWSAGGTSANRIAKWDGANWSALGSGTDDWVNALAIHPATGDLYVGGDFTSAGGVTNTSGIARWDGSAWYEVGGGTWIVNAIAIDPASGDVYAGGRFTGIGAVSANSIARWDGSQWYALGGGLTGGTGWYPEVYAIAIDGSDVYVAGDFTNAGGVPVAGVARWDGSQWHALGSGLLNPGIGGSAGTGNALTVGDAGLYVGGLFIRAGHKPSYNFGLWHFPAPDLAVTQSDAPDPAFSGQPLTYTLTVDNNGLLDAGNVVLTDTLPAGVTYGSATATQGSSCSQLAGVVTCNLGGLAVGSSAGVTVTVTPVAGGLITNTVVAGSGQVDMNSTDNTATATTAIDPADLAVSKTASPDPAFSGQPLTYTLTVANNGPLAANAVTLVDTLPGGVSFGSASTSQGTGCAENGGMLTCNLGSLSNGSNAVVTVVVTPTSTGVLTNTATVSTTSFDPAISNNTTSHVLTVEQFVEAFDNGIPPGWQVIDAGRGIGSTATWSGTNPCQRAIDSPASDPWLMVDSDCAGPGDEQDEQLISPLIDATACNSVQLSFTSQFRSHSLEIGDVDVSLDGGSTWVNVLRLQGFNDGYPTPVLKTLDVSTLAAGNSFQVRFYYRNAHFDWWWAVDDFSTTCSQTAPELPALTLTKIDLADPATVGSALSYQIEVTNSGAFPATGVTISDTLPTSVTFGLATPSQGTCNPPSGQLLTCQMGDLAPGGSVQVTIVVTPTSEGTLTNTARVFADQIEQVLSDNTDSETTTITTQAQSGQLQFTQSSYTVSEDGGTAVITVTRTNGNSGAVTVDYATSDGTATAGSDYTAASGTLTFADGETSKSFTVTILNDALNESDETVLLRLSNPTGGGALGTPSQATIIISQSGYNVFLPVVIR